MVNVPSDLKSTTRTHALLDCPRDGFVEPRLNTKRTWAVPSPAVSLPSNFDHPASRAARLHLPLVPTKVPTSVHWALLALHDPSIRALSPEAAAVVLRKTQTRRRRKGLQDRGRL